MKQFMQHLQTFVPFVATELGFYAQNFAHRGFAPTQRYFAATDTYNQSRISSSMTLCFAVHLPVPISILLFEPIGKSSMTILTRTHQKNLTILTKIGVNFIAVFIQHATGLVFPCLRPSIISSMCSFTTGVPVLARSDVHTDIFMPMPFVS
jgi:hypothetical protein